MKRAAIILVILLLLPLVSAVEVNVKGEFFQGETLMAKISGNFIEPPLKENVLFYRDHVKISLEYGLFRGEEEYYLYAQLADKKEGNYSFVIENVKYYVGAKISEEDIVHKFIINNQTVDFTINPGYVIAEDEFTIEIRNLQDKQITVEITTNDSWEFSTPVILKSGEPKIINFKVKEPDQSKMTKINFKTENLEYSLPVYLYVSSLHKKTQDFEFLNTDFSVNLSTRSSTTRIIYLNNTGEEDLKNISIFVSELLLPYVNLSIENVDKLDSGEDIQIKLEITSGEEEKQIGGEIRAKTQNLSQYFNLDLNFIKNYVSLKNETEVPRKDTCLKLNGTICEEEQECSGSTTYASDGICCLENCEEKSSGSSGKLLGWLMIIVIIIVLIWFFKSKFFGTKRNIDLIKIAKGR